LEAELRRTLESGLEVDVLGRCTGPSFCTEVATLAVTLIRHNGEKDSHTYGMCQKHVDANYLSAEEYEKRRERWGSSTLGIEAQERDDYEIRPLTIQEAAEVAYEQAAPERWEAEGTIGKVRRIVEMHQCEEIDGVLVDATSAQIVIAIHDKLNETNKAKLAAMPIGVMCAFALKLYDRVQHG
jgi:Zn-finger nucleic acid-binding protein